MTYAPYIFDLILLFIISGFFFYGLFFGFLRALGSLVGYFAGAIIASKYFDNLMPWITNLIGDRAGLAKVLAFLVLFFLVNQFIGWAFYLLDRVVHLLHFIPFLKTFNRILGAGFGVVEGGLIVGLVLWVVSIFAGRTIVGDWIAHSLVAKVLLPLVDYSIPYFPEIIEKVQALAH
ncbi:MAG: hypothetical protein COT39_04250 [Parcubacteria group bacterium CG08_land_8_20_14_0_20_48_21]|nr:MAG: hypothetical protein AUK21_02460 [Parcubacteria group bacterium CG2_30_48_51]PIS32486.1 MAG: hypothetical protein COT39_04250 [Parcubacteria group bacterium CG08_land_8_20_14_0_20_48_21]PIW78834.1 MAG: hypothetical protein COZ99_04320 [Parcubacteria group bacterium CG_4_8_14_3_um_filter_48_16]PIY78007.1 MAG: hypothetical protein COY83_02200 [Parcubacteria group bacterium CG_4_10_14_0_8_um_filter_48_154]PIZ77124.1 MAG: hypothetical protein COY03_03930 [bacterium CG_4_10_14_0_2_um_filter_